MQFLPNPLELARITTIKYRNKELENVPAEEDEN